MKTIVYIFFIFLFFACESKISYKKPKNLIPKKQMVDLLYDMHIANGTTGVRSKYGKKKINYMALVYEKYNIDSTQFSESNTYYISKISEYEEMFKEVEKRLEKLRKHYENQRDSLIKEKIDTNKVKASFKRIKELKKIKK